LQRALGIGAVDMLDGAARAIWRASAEQPGRQRCSGCWPLVERLFTTRQSVR
jgi:hypothetical protein